ncbi:hypothetical protein SLA2020_018850 [Shorea laevis]
MFCSTGCVVNITTFSGSLQEERCSVLNLSKLNEILRLFRVPISDDSNEGLGRNGMEWRFRLCQISRFRRIWKQRLAKCAISCSSFTSNFIKQDSGKKSKESKGKVKVISKDEPDEVPEAYSTSNAYHNGSSMLTAEAVKENHMLRKQTYLLRLCLNLLLDLLEQKKA